MLTMRDKNHDPVSSSPFSGTTLLMSNLSLHQIWIQMKNFVDVIEQVTGSMKVQLTDR